MPEGPEVKRMALSLSERLRGETITEAHVLGGKWLRTPPKGIEEFQRILPQRVVAVDGFFGILRCPWEEFRRVLYLPNLRISSNHIVRPPWVVN